MKINSPQFNLMQKACIKASKVLIRDFGEVEKLQVSEKGPGDLMDLLGGGADFNANPNPP